VDSRRIRLQGSRTVQRIGVPQIISAMRIVAGTANPAPRGPRPRTIQHGPRLIQKRQIISPTDLPPKLIYADISQVGCRLIVGTPDQASGSSIFSSEGLRGHVICRPLLFCKGFFEHLIKTGCGQHQIKPVFAQTEPSTHVSTRGSLSQA
jgi:hypothetical protein